jgi:hypothetical protein
MDLRRGHEQGRELLAAGDDAEFRGLLDAGALNSKAHAAMTEDANWIIRTLPIMVSSVSVM